MSPLSLVFSGPMIRLAAYYFAVVSGALKVTALDVVEIPACTHVVGPLGSVRGGGSLSQIWSGGGFVSASDVDVFGKRLRTVERRSKSLNAGVSQYRLYPYSSHDCRRR